MCFGFFRILPHLSRLSSPQPVPEIRSRVATAKGLTEEDRQEMLSSGRQTVLANRISWALLYLERAGLTERIRRGVWRLTAEGQRLLTDPPPRIDLKYLGNYPTYIDWRASGASKNTSSFDGVSSTPPADESVDTPEEALDRAARQLREALETEVLDRVREAPPEFLERLVVDLLIAMGYGGGDAAMGRVTGRPGDGGIDGTIREDALGLDEIYLQAKRYALGSAVGADDLHKFVGALDGAGTTKGVFITTSSFTQPAKNYVAQSKRIVLIDGEELARLMVAHDIGVRGTMTYEIKRVDENYFDSEDL